MNRNSRKTSITCSASKIALMVLSLWGTSFPTMAAELDLNANITGTYNSDITTNTNWFFKHKKHRKLLITLEQIGDNVTGSDTFTNASIKGTRTGDIVTFEYWSPPVNRGYRMSGQWEVSVDGTKLTGSWSDPSGQASGKWNLTRTE